MIIFILLISFINYILCCYTNKTFYETLYISTTIETKTFTPTPTCITSYITSINYYGGCIDINYNKGSNCRPKTSIIETSICTTTTIENMYTTIISTPTTLRKIYEYKLDCKNKTSSSLINII